MLEGLADEEVYQYLQENPKIVPLFEIDVAEAVAPYIMQPENADEELNKEVESAEEDFKKFNQEYDKDRIVEQVC